MTELVIADTSCLIVLYKIQQINLLQSLFTSISITPEIKEEFGENLPDWIKVQPVEDRKRQKILELDLDRGESSAIALALENEHVLLLMDEKKGRRIATDLGLKIMGTLGVIIKAKENQLITSIKEEIEKLRLTDFRISEKLIQQILDKYEKK